MKKRAKKTTEKKRIVLAYCRAHGRLPKLNETAVPPTSYRGYYCKSSGQYDSIFHKQLIKTGALRPYKKAKPQNPAQRKKEVLNWVSKHGRLPYRSSDNSTERRLGVLRRTYTDLKYYPGQYDLDFHKALLMKLAKSL